MKADEEEKWPSRFLKQALQFLAGNTHCWTTGKSQEGADISSSSIYHYITGFRLSYLRSSSSCQDPYSPSPQNVWRNEHS